MQEAWTNRRVTEFLRPQEVEALTSLVPLDSDRLLLRVLWETGGRPGEVTRLVPEHIDQKNNCILLPNFKQNKRPGGVGPRRPHPLKRIYLFPESTLCEDLLVYTAEQHIHEGSWVFPQRRDTSKPFSTLTLWRLVTGVARDLGIRYIKKDTRTGEYMNKPAWPGLYRHGAAVFMLDRTGRLDVVRDQLGHSSVRTSEIYATLTDESRRKIIRGDEDNNGP